MTLDNPHFAILVAINTIAGLVVMWQSVCTVNHMSLHTPWSIRLAYIMEGVGGAAVVFAPAYFHQAPSVGELLLVCALATIAAVDRRRRNRRALLNGIRPGRGLRRRA